MNSQSAAQLLAAIDQTIGNIDKVTGRDPTVDSYLAQFLVVYICGMYEEAIENILVDFAQRYSSRTEIVVYMQKSIDETFRNPDSEKILKIVSRLDNKSWYTTLKSMSAERIALDNIVNNKNNLAHGRGLTITLSEVKNYHKDSQVFIKKLDALLT